jgi:NADH-quinone oxidoreductase subunit M
MRWASGVVVALGAVTAVYGALGALGQTDLRKLAAAGTTAQVGFVLLGAGSLTPQGLSGAMVLASTRALACALFLVVAGAVEDRAHTRDVARLEGVATQMPGWASALAVAALAQAGVMGLGGAWGPMLALLGALPNYPPLALLGALALLLAAAAHFVALSRIIFGKLGEEWQKSPLLEAFGGRFPDLTAREWTSVAPLATLVLLLGVWPASLFASTTGTVRDLTNAVSPPGPEQIALASPSPATSTLASSPSRGYFFGAGLPAGLPAGLAAAAGFSAAGGARTNAAARIAERFAPPTLSNLPSGEALPAEVIVSVPSSPSASLSPLAMVSSSPANEP